MSCLRKTTSRLIDTGNVHELQPQFLIITVGACTYLYEAEHPVMEGSGGVIFGQNGTNQNSFNKLLRCHQNMEAMATVLHAGLKNLSDSGAVTQYEKVQM